LTPDEQVRLARLEQKVSDMDGWLKSIDGNVTKLVAASNMANGAWGATLKIGGLLVVAAAAISGVFNALLWAWQNVRLGH
jgi:hypothetical protein